MTEELNVAMKERDSWMNRAVLAEKRCQELLNDNTELWKLIKNLAKVNETLASKISGDI